METRKPVVSFIDLETSPILSYNWGTYEQNAIKVKDSWEILSFAVKYGDSPTKVYSKEGKTDESLVKKLWEVFDKSDILVAHNGDKFDIRKANTRFIFWGLTPPSPYKTIDTLKMARKYAKFDSNRLDDLGAYLGVGRKMKHTGIDLWFDCMKGDEKAIKMMARYNRQDAELLYNVYHKLKSWSTNHPNMSVFEEVRGCPVCGEEKLTKRGFSVTRTGKKQRFQCVSCGAWSHDKAVSGLVTVS